MIFFFTHHQANFEYILSCERALSFHGTLKKVLEVLDGLGHQSLKQFVIHWKQKTDTEILDTLDDKKKAIFQVLQEKLDNDKNNVISYDEFVLFAHKHDVFDVDILWDVLTHHKKTIKCIDSDVIDYMLYHTLFYKKQLALAIDTDILLASWIMLYTAMFSAPFVGILLSGVWGYAGAFGGNLNLFQIYVLVASFTWNRLASNIRFAIYMSTVRPFNLGELLLMDGDVYKVTRLCPTFVIGVGRDTIILRNSQMLDDMVHNFSRSNINDSFALELPLNTRDSLVQEVYEKMILYAEENWKEIDVVSIRCGWVSIQNQSKVLQCNWRYNFMIYDRNKFNTTKTRFVNEVIRTTIDDVSKSILLNASQGSALITEVVEHYKTVAR